MSKPALNLRPIVKKIRAFYFKSKRLPSFAELCDVLGYRSKGAVSKVVDRLLEEGFLEKDSKGKLLPTTRLKGGIKLLGVVQAGFPSPAEEELIDTISMDEFLITRPEATYLVKVKGDSMIDAGIQPNDLVLVERGRDAKSGDIVIAEVDGEWTMKYYLKKGKHVILRAANENYEDIIPSFELSIGGVVTACVRKYIKN